MLKTVLLSTSLFLMLLAVPSAAQNLTAKTNNISLSFSNGAEITTDKLPAIKWVVPAFDFTNSAENLLELQADIQIQNNVSEIRLISGRTTDRQVVATKIIDGWQGKSLFRLQQRVFLPEGSNFIEIEVKAGDVKISDYRTILVGADAEENLLATNRKDYALLFATDKYDHWDDLVNPVNDAHAIAKELEEKFNFKTEIVENPTMEEIWEKLREYNERKFGPQDQLLIFFAGHGYYDETFGEGFVAARNSLTKDLSRSTYLSHNRLRGVVSNISCKHILLMMDVCFGGTLDPVIARGRGKENELSKNDLVVRKLRYRTRKYLTSGGKEYVSDGTPGKHSPFAESVIESLRSRGGDDGLLTLSEMQTFLEKLKQQPRSGSFADDEPLSDFVFVTR